MTAEVNQEVQTDAELAREKVRESAQRATQASAEILDKAVVTVNSVKHMWQLRQQELLAKIGNTPENAQAIAEAFDEIQLHHINAVYNASQFVEMYNYHIVGAGEFDIGARYVIDDFVRGYLNHAPAIPLEHLNIVDKTIGGWNNPNLSTDALPISELEQDPQNARIPVRVETFNSFITGYLEMFRFRKEINGNVVTLVTTSPVIRSKDNYHTLNSVYRWFPITEEKLRQDWAAGKSYQQKKVPNTIGNTNPETEVAENDSN